MELKVFRFGDLIVIFSVITTFIFSAKIFNGNNSIETVVVFRDNRIIARYPLDENRVFSVEGAEGKIKILIKDRGVKVLESNCPHKICVRSGEIKRANSQIVCAPNHIMVVIESAKEDSIDAVTR